MTQNYDLEKMLKKETRDAFITVLVIAAILLLFAQAHSGFNMPMYFFTNNDIAKDAVTEDDSYQKTKVYAVFDCIGSDDEGSFFVIPTEDNGAYLMYVYNENVPRFQALSDATFDYLDGVTDEIEGEVITVRGLAYNADSELYSYLTDWGTESGYCSDGNTSALKDSYLTYITPKKLLSYYGLDTVFTVLTLVAVYCALIWAIIGGVAFKLKRTVKRLDYDYNEIERDFASSERLSGAYIGEKYCVVANMGNTDVARLSDIVWVYKNITTTQHKVYFIPVGKSVSYSVVIVTAECKSLTTACKTEQDADLLVERFSKLGGIVCGYSDEIATLAKNDFPSLKELAETVDVAE
jgi:hypothetical protein